MVDPAVSSDRGSVQGINRVLAGFIAAALVQALVARAQPPPPRGTYIEFKRVYFDIATDRVVGSHFAKGVGDLSVRQYDYYLEAIPRDTTMTLDLPGGDLAVHGSELSNAGGDALVERELRVVNRPRRESELKTWTRPDCILEGIVVDVTYNTYSDPPKQSSIATVIVDWTVRIPGQRAPALEATTSGRDTATGVGEECIQRAFVDALLRLLDDERFSALAGQQRGKE